MSQTLLEDLEQIISDTNIPWDKLRNSCVLVTGATGAIGSAIIRALSSANKKHQLNVRVLASGRNKKKAQRLAEEYGINFFCQDICEPLAMDERLDYIFHCVAVTKSSEMMANPTEVIATSLQGTCNVLELATAKRVKSMVYLSSMEVYGVTDPTLPFITERDLGYIDLKNPRSCYPESKRMCECLCNCFFYQYELPIKIARLAQTFGAGSEKNDSRVFAQFARNAIDGKDIILHTEGKSRGNYCYISDTVRGLLVLLLKGENGEAYNIANPGASMTIREMAELVAKKACGGRISVIVDIPSDITKRGYAPDVTMRLSTDKISKLNWRPKYGLAEMYKRMIADWQEDFGYIE